MPDAPQGKKLPKWAIPVGLVGAAGLFIYLRKKKSESPTASATGAEAEGLTNQSFIPVTGGAGAGASLPVGGGFGESGSIGSSNTDSALLQYIQSQNTATEAHEKLEHEFFEHMFSQLSTGGGAPSSSGGAGTTTAPPPQTQAPIPVAPAPVGTPSSPPTPRAACPGPKGFPFQGPHGCWHWSRTTHEGCKCHGYENGLLECEHKRGGVCTF